MHLKKTKNYVYKLQDPQKPQINNKTSKRLGSLGVRNVYE